MNDAQWSEFLVKGEDWIPSQDHSVPVAAIFPGDTLLMLPGNHNAHAPITLEDCEMVGGMFWDTRKVVQIVEQILQQAEHSHISNETVPKQLTPILVEPLFNRRQKKNVN